MEKLILFLFLIVLASCGEKGSSGKSEPDNILENLSFTVDTVMIDSKGKTFDLERGYSESSVSADRKFVFLYNSHSSAIQQINLDELVWEKDHSFEAEGPNGISHYVYSAEYLGGNQFLIASHGKLGIFDTTGSKVKELSVSLLPISSDLDELDYGVILSKDQKNLFSLPGTRFVGNRTFGKIDLETFEIENFSIPEMDWIFDLKVIFKGGFVYQEYLDLNELNNQILISSPSTSSFYSYNLESDSLSYHSFVHQLSPVINEVQLRGQVESMEDYEEEMGRFFEGINFGPLIWDEKREIYFRFARKPTLMDGSFEVSSSQIFLYAYDQEFNLIGETFLPTITSRFDYPFFKDGKLWSYVNVEDELGFAMFSFDF